MNAAAFETLYRRYREWVWSLACRLCPDSHTAMDVTQETFMYLLRRAPTLKLSGRLTTFLYPAVKHLSIDAVRASKRMRIGTGQQAAASPPPPLGGNESLIRVVDSLPEHEREVLLMRYVSGMSLGEIAAALEIPVGTVKSRHHSAVAALREKLGN
ncbi:MAG TPA: sigma-70 family RNA polymerase sigma factor [Phycisphaerales bacterium]|nr:sigma-70 family RNA polymerase sigma factor [Phycisphaerales bacterium]